jgi:hypothetical protein
MGWRDRRTWGILGAMKGVRAILALALTALALAPAQALAVNPEDTVGGTGSKWFGGSLMQQSGLNCTIIGGAYSETMVSAIAEYGGAPGGGVPKVGDRYYAALLVSIPGNPCGTGSSLVGTDLVLPRGTSVDTSAPIRCFGQPRNQNTFQDITNQGWNFLNSSGQYCPAQVGSSLTGTAGAVGVGFRPLANGQLYELFVPIKSTQALQGAAHNPVDQIQWVLSTSGTYSQTGSTAVWTNVFPSGTPSGPFIYFARNPSVVPFWNTSPTVPPPDSNRNQAEWFANLYSAGKTGTLCFQLFDATVDNNSVIGDCHSAGLTWNGTVTTAGDTWQVNGGGPNGGFVPFGGYTPNHVYRIRWIFTPTTGTPVSNDINFTAISGPDADGDGVPDQTDACPSTKGTLPNGCQPDPQQDPDGDGVFGPADKCPNDNGGASPDGCPPGGPSKPADTGVTPSGSTGQTTQTGGLGQQQQQQQVNPPALTLTGGLGAIKGNKIPRKALAKGYPLKVTCGADSDAAASLTITSAIAKKLKIKVPKKAKTVTIGSAKGQCTASNGGTLKLKLARSAASKVKKSRKAIAASLGVTFTRNGSAPFSVKKSVKLS